MQICVTRPQCVNGSYKIILYKWHVTARGRDCVVDLAPRYGLECPVIESRWGGGARFSTPLQTGPGAHSASYKMGTGSFPEVKWSERGVEHQPPSSAEVKEKVWLCLYSPSGHSWPVLWWICERRTHKRITVDSVEYISLFILYLYINRTGNQQVVP